jgi:hypothetical protein
MTPLDLAIAVTIKTVLNFAFPLAIFCLSILACAWRNRGSKRLVQSADDPLPCKLPEGAKFIGWQHIGHERLAFFNAINGSGYSLGTFTIRESHLSHRAIEDSMQACFERHRERF